MFILLGFSVLRVFLKENYQASASFVHMPLYNCTQNYCMIFIFDYAQI